MARRAMPDTRPDVRIYIPKELGTLNLEVGVNGRFYSYQRGTYQTVPAEVATIIERSVEAAEGSGAFEAFIVKGNSMGANLS